MHDLGARLLDAGGDAMSFGLFIRTEYDATLPSSLSNLSWAHEALLLLSQD
jgi:hypothetical protein